MHILIYHVVKHLIRGLVIVFQHLIPHAPAAHAAVRHAANAHVAAAHNLAMRQAASNTFRATAMPAAPMGGVPLSSTAAALHAQNVQSSIMASVGQQQAAAIPDVGDFSSFSS
jgi:hypothetical protein